MEHAKEYTVRVSSRALAMLERHTRFLARVSVPAARRLSADYRKAVASLKVYPERFPFVEAVDVPPQTYRRCLFARRYELIFLLTETSVFVDAVRDCRQAPGSLFSQIN
jgi:plasmid stabilization system protein ParE